MREPRTILSAVTSGSWISEPWKRRAAFAVPSLVVGIFCIWPRHHLYIAPVRKVVGVYGATYSPGSYLYTQVERLEDYLRQAGGARRKIAAEAEIFIVRANGSVVSREEKHGRLHEFAQLGDVIFVPVRTGPSLFDRLLAVSQLVFQYGFGFGTLALSVHDLT